jgi:hypothetical protein
MLQISETSNIRDRFDHLYKLMGSSRFLNKEGLGNEVPFFICPFKVQETKDMYLAVKQLRTRLEQACIPILEVNLYELSMTILQSRGLLEKTIEIEKSITKQKLLEQLQMVLDTQKHLIPAIAKVMQEIEFKIMFITGVGEVFPYIRSHNILNNLQSTAKDKPTVLFFPGEYNTNESNGSTLKLFGLLEDKYYRAFNIYHCQI